MHRLCSPDDLLSRLDTLSGKRVLVIGDVMLDTYLVGDAQRISPEAPVPVGKNRAGTASSGRSGKCRAEYCRSGAERRHLLAYAGVC